MGDEWLAALAARVAQIEKAGDTADEAANLGTWEALGRAAAAADAATLSAAARLWQRMISALPVGNPARAVMLGNLCLTLLNQYLRTGEPADVEAAVVVGQHAVEDTGDEELPERELYLADALRARFELRRNRADLGDAIARLGQALGAAPDGSPRAALFLAAYADCLRVRFEESGNRDDLDEAVRSCERGAEVAEDGARTRLLLSLGGILTRRFEQSGERVDIDNAIGAFLQAEGAVPEADRAICLSGLGGALRMRFGVTGSAGDLAEAVGLTRQAAASIPDGHPDRHACLANLGIALLIQATYGGHDADQQSAELAEAIDACREAARSLPDGHRLRAALLASLSNALRAGSAGTGSRASLDEAIALAREAVAAASAGQPERAAFLVGLCATLGDRYRIARDLADADEAIDAGRRALDALPEVPATRMQALRAQALLALGAVMTLRSGLPGQADGLEEAIIAYRQAVGALPAGQPDHEVAACNLGITLWQQFQHTGHQGDIDEAITVLQSVARDLGDGSAEGGLALFSLGGALLDRYASHGQDGRGDANDLTAAVAALRRSLGAPVIDPDGPARYQWKLGEALLRRFELTGEQADLAEAVTVSTQAVEATPTGHPSHGLYQLGLGRALAAQDRHGQAAAPAANAAQARAELAARLAALVDAVSADTLPSVLAPGALDDARRLSALIEADESHDLDTLSVLGRFYLLRFQSRHADDADQDDDADEDADRAAAAGAYALPFWAGRPVPEQLAPLVAATVMPDALADTHLRVMPSGDAAVLGEAADLWRRITDAFPADIPERAVSSGILGIVLLNRSEIAGTAGDLADGIAALQEAVDALPADHPFVPAFQANLSGGRQASTEGFGLPDFDVAIAAATRAAEEAAGMPVEEIFRWQVGRSILDRYQLSGDQDDLESALEILARAVTVLPHGTPELGTALASLCEAQRLKFTMTGDPDLLDQAISHGRTALAALPAGQAARIAAIDSLGTALLARAVRSGGPEELDTAIDLLGGGIAAAPPGSWAGATLQSRLGGALLARFTARGDQADLDDAVKACGAALARTPRASPDWARHAGTLARALLTRSERTGGGADLDAAITLSRDAVAALSAGHHDRGLYLADQARALRRKSIRTGEPRYLDESIEASREALSTVADGHAARPMYQVDLASSLQTRAGLTSDDEDDQVHDYAADLADINESIALLQSAADATTGDFLLHPLCQAELGFMLYGRFTLTEDQPDRHDAVAALRSAISLSEGQPAQLEYMLRLVSILSLEYDLSLQYEEPKASWHLDEAIALCTRVTGTVSASTGLRITAARIAADLARPTRPAVAADFLDAAVRLLPQAASRQLSRADQQHTLGQYSFLAAEAAELALVAGQPDAPARALGLLELGRAVLQGQALDTRRDLLDLYASHPRLAGRFAELRDQLDKPDGEGLSVGAAWELDPAAAAGPALRATERFQAGTEFAALLHHIRQLDGFESFLLPPAPGELTRHAGDGPIVAFTIGRARSDALIVTVEGITDVPVPGLAGEPLVEKIDAWDTALATVLRRDAAPDERFSAERVLSEVLEWLWDVAAGPVLTRLGYHDAPEPGRPWPRVWWATGGLLGMLPLHAAGYHRQPGGHDTVLDRVASSYTPTVRALAHARERASGMPPRRSLIVAMPATPGLAPLPNVGKEAGLLAGLLPSPSLLIGDDDAAPGTVPTRDAVLAGLADAGIAHFTCHATSHPDDPSRSQIFLHDHRERPFTVGTLIPARLRHAQLAYLSACRTARSESLDLLDEGIHLTSAFQLAGFPHVIGTLWPILDRVAVDVAAGFYTRLRSPSGSLDVNASAAALHDCVRELRDRKGFTARPSLWAGYVHAGA